MADWFDDLEGINALGTGGYGGRGLPTYGYPSNPTSNFLQGFGTAQNIVANQMKIKAMRNALQEQRALKESMQGFNVENPDYSKILPTAPNYTVKLMQGINQMDMNKRLAAANAATNATQFLQMGLGHYQENKDAYPFLIKQGQKMGIDQGILDMVPRPELYDKDPLAFRRAVGNMIDYSGNLKIEAKQVEQIEKRLTDANKYKQMEMLKYIEKQIKEGQTTGKIDVASINQGTAKINAASREKVAEFGFQKAQLPKGIGKEDKAPGISLRRKPGESQYDTQDLSGYNAVIRTGNPEKIAEAQRRMKQKYGSLPE